MHWAVEIVELNLKCSKYGLVLAYKMVHAPVRVLTLFLAGPDGGLLATKPYFLKRQLLVVLINLLAYVQLIIRDTKKIKEVDLIYFFIIILFLN